MTLNATTSSMWESTLSILIRSQLSCDENHPRDVYVLSKLCVNGSYEDHLDCVSHLDQQRPYRATLGVWGIVVTIVGVLGNLLTLLAVPYAANQKKYCPRIKIKE